MSDLLSEDFQVIQSAPCKANEPLSSAVTISSFSEQLSKARRFDLSSITSLEDLDQLLASLRSQTCRIDFDNCVIRCKPLFKDNRSFYFNYDTSNCVFELIILDIRRQKTYRVKTDLDSKYSRCKDLMFLEEKVYFSRQECYADGFGSQVIECDP